MSHPFFQLAGLPASVTTGIAAGPRPIDTTRGSNYVSTHDVGEPPERTRKGWRWFGTGSAREGPRPKLTHLEEMMLDLP